MAPLTGTVVLDVRSTGPTGTVHILGKRPGRPTLARRRPSEGERSAGHRATPLVLHPRQRGCLRVRALAVGPSGRCRPGRRLLLLSALRWGRAPLVPEEEGQAGDDGADPDPEPKEIAL